MTDGECVHIAMEPLCVPYCAVLCACMYVLVWWWWWCACVHACGCWWCVCLCTCVLMRLLALAQIYRLTSVKLRFASPLPQQIQVSISTSGRRHILYWAVSDIKLCKETVKRQSNDDDDEVEDFSRLCTDNLKSESQRLVS